MSRVRYKKLLKRGSITKISRLCSVSFHNLSKLLSPPKVGVRCNGVHMRLLLILSLFASSVSASEFDIDTYSTSLDFAQVKDVLATQKPSGNWCFGTSVRHNDQGWEHYANGWEVIDFDGNQLGYRELAHPHDNEQPFTRSQCNIEIPLEITRVVVRAKCNKHGFGGKPFIVELKPL